MKGTMNMQIGDHNNMNVGIPATRQLPVPRKLAYYIFKIFKDLGE